MSILGPQASLLAVRLGSTEDARQYLLSSVLDARRGCDRCSIGIDPIKRTGNRLFEHRSEGIGTIVART